MDTRQVLGEDYRPRIIDAVLVDALGTAGAVVIEGPRACGKTMTALNTCASYVFLDEADIQTRLEVAPDSILDGAQPRLLDEWQVAPELWNRVRRRVDRSRQPGSFILTGSALPADDATRHTGAGRFLRLRQHTMAWAELRPELTAISLADLFNGFTPATSAPVFGLAELVTQLTTSGFPALSRLRPDQAARLLRAYLQEITHADLG